MPVLELQELGLTGGVRSVSVGSLGLAACSTEAGGDGGNGSITDAVARTTDGDGQESSSGGKG